jgi:hypothetical protein
LCVLQVAAQVDDGPCVMYIGEGGAGNFVKMVHNGIEYGDMQLISGEQGVGARFVGHSACLAGYQGTGAALGGVRVHPTPASAAPPPGACN